MGSGPGALEGGLHTHIHSHTHTLTLPPPGQDMLELSLFMKFPWFRWASVSPLNPPFRSGPLGAVFWTCITATPQAGAASGSVSVHTSKSQDTQNSKDENISPSEYPVSMETGIKGNCLMREFFPP